MSKIHQLLDKSKVKAKALKSEIMALYLAYKRPDVPWYAKLFSILVVGYALSPVDLIPDFIPVLGYLDDLILIPLGITLAIKMIPPDVMAECREQARLAKMPRRPENRVAGAVIILIWVFAAGLIVYKIFVKK